MAAKLPLAQRAPALEAAEEKAANAEVEDRGRPGAGAAKISSGCGRRSQPPPPQLLRRPPDEDREGAAEAGAGTAAITTSSSSSATTSTTTMTVRRCLPPGQSLPPTARVVIRMSPAVAHLEGVDAEATGEVAKGEAEQDKGNGPERKTTKGKTIRYRPHPSPSAAVVPAAVEVEQHGRGGPVRIVGNAAGTKRGRRRPDPVP